MVLAKVNLKRELNPGPFDFEIYCPSQLDHAETLSNRKCKGFFQNICYINVYCDIYSKLDTSKGALIVTLIGINRSVTNEVIPQHSSSKSRSQTGIELPRTFRL